MTNAHIQTRYRRQLSEENALLLSILDGTSNETGEAFFRALVRELAAVLDTFGALVADYLPEMSQLRPRAYWLGDDWVDPGPYDISGTPCEGVIKRGELFQIPDRVIEHYPQNRFIQTYDLVSYTGMPFKDSAGNIIGHLAVLDSKPIPNEARYLALFEIFGNRAAAEMRRIMAEDELREREERLRSLIDGALDGIIDFDDQLNIHMTNHSANKLFHGQTSGERPTSLCDWFETDSIQLIQEVMKGLPAAPADRQAWIGSRLRGLRADGSTFDIEATLSQGTHRESSFYTLILRDVHALHDAQRQIHHLQRQTEQLRVELAALQERGQIVGESEAFKAALAKVSQVAATNATVLLLGETGSGKEVFARAIHESSTRSDRPLVTVNCAAIPRDLVESEFFGHVKGAFTGATAQRDGRFLIADGGTIFLDEIGELPMDVQAKLLRVLQEGELSPVGSSKSHRIDVRVIAATNRNLADAVSKGEFREDLFYRLNVFPIEIPSLRDRREDILPLASLFAQRAADRLGRPRKRLHKEHAQRLLLYHWPGNVRELQNIIEHAVITSQDDWLYPEVILDHPAPYEVPARTDAGQAIMTADELRILYRDNILRALEAANGRISGDSGAARLLNIKPSTLRSQMRAHGIQD
ncbi:MAG: sigma 54-interacting transcriptional regulator [Chromatiaceae bacterium]|nr:sigma 54-interacting transcriptional regulator [Chromatiaceae bacterium]